MVGLRPLEAGILVRIQAWQQESMKKTIATGVVHSVPADMRDALLSSEKVREAWNDLTPLARNEWICWVTSVKKLETRQNHIERLRGDMVKGKRRPCCWAGCPHR